MLKQDLYNRLCFFEWWQDLCMGVHYLFKLLMWSECRISGSVCCLCLSSVFEFCVWVLCLSSVFEFCLSSSSWVLCLSSVFEFCVWVLSLSSVFEFCLWVLSLSSVFEFCLWVRLFRWLDIKWRQDNGKEGGKGETRGDKGRQGNIVKGGVLLQGCWWGFDCGIKCFLCFSFFDSSDLKTNWSLNSYLN